MNRILLLLFLLMTVISSCAPLRPVTTTQNEDLFNYKYIYIPNTEHLTSSKTTTLNGEYYASTKSVNPADVIAGVMAKKGFVRLPELRDEFIDNTVIVNYGESNRRELTIGHTLEVTIQFVSSEYEEIICSCTAEGDGYTDADIIREAIIRCVSNIIE